MSLCPTPEKTKFRSERAAKAGLRAIKHPHGLMKAYRCGAHWHIGHGNLSRHMTPKTKKTRRNR